MVNVTGIADVLRSIQHIQQGVPRTIRKATASVAKKTAKNMRDYAPKGEGTLSGAIKIEPDRNTETVYAVNVGPHDDLRKSRRGTPYSVFQEFGTNRHAAQPYVRPALDANMKSGQRKIGEAIIKVCMK